MVQQCVSKLVLNVWMECLAHAEWEEEYTPVISVSNQGVISMEGVAITIIGILQ